MVTIGQIIYSFGGFNPEGTLYDPHAAAPPSSTSPASASEPLAAALPIANRAPLAGTTLGHLLRLDLPSLHWTDLTPLTVGPAPLPRANHGLAETGGLLYVFGGCYQMAFQGPWEGEAACAVSRRICCVAPLRSGEHAQQRIPVTTGIPDHSGTFRNIPEHSGIPVSSEQASTEDTGCCPES